MTHLYHILRDSFGPRQWWPADTPWEVMVGAILTQNTNWKNVEAAIRNLKRAERLEAPLLASAAPEELQELVRPAGYFRQKSARLKGLAQWWLESTGGSTEGLADRSVEDLRRELLAIKGIGPETADSIILYALGKPTFVVDAYTARICGRHGLIEPGAGYMEIKELFESSLPVDTELYQDYHAQLVELGKRFCRKKPLCGKCPVLAELGSPLIAEDEF